jgi:methionine synthase I (cobalamin-dependent)
MVNGQLPTWYVIKRISEDRNLYAKAPETEEFYAAKAVHLSGDVAMFAKKCGQWNDFTLEVTTRSDWTLYRRGKKMMKPEPKTSTESIELGKLYIGRNMKLGAQEMRESINKLKLYGYYTVVAIPCGD